MVMHKAAQAHILESFHSYLLTTRGGALKEAVRPGSVLQVSFRAQVHQHSYRDHSLLHHEPFTDTKIPTCIIAF